LQAIFGESLPNHEKLIRRRRDAEIAAKRVVEVNEQGRGGREHAEAAE
jgi:hypothetical protein